MGASSVPTHDQTTGANTGFDCCFAVFDRLFITSSLFTFPPVKMNVSLYDPQILQGLN